MGEGSGQTESVCRSLGLTQAGQKGQLHTWKNVLSSGKGLQGLLQVGPSDVRVRVWICLQWQIWPKALPLFPATLGLESVPTSPHPGTWEGTC